MTQLLLPGPPQAPPDDRTGARTASIRLAQAAARTYARARASGVLQPALLALGAGILSAAFYYAWDLALSHYDAKAHLVVARRILDSLRPGWKQIGAVWLPLPHLLNVLPVQVDLLYRTGLSAIALSIAGFTIAGVSLWRMVVRATGSRIAGWAAFAVFVAQPDVLYLQATPMTEPLLMGLSLLGIERLSAWVASRGTRSAWPAGVALALACLTRYEAWPIAAAALTFALFVLVRTGVAPGRAVARVSAVAIHPACAIAAFMVLSRLTVGTWLVTGGFFERDDTLYRQLPAVTRAMWEGVVLLNGRLLVLFAAIGFAGLCFAVLRHRRWSHLIVPLALAACAALPLYAFWNGHPFRIRYLVPLTMSLAAITGLGVGLLPRGRALAGRLVILTALLETPPLVRDSPMVVEAQRDAPDVAGRRAVTACLAADYDGSLILASMGSLAHYMHETAHAGFNLRQFIHEGIGQLWQDSMVEADRHAGWVLIEERAEGGDVLARLRDGSPAFLERFERRCDGGGVALYGRKGAPPVE